MTDNDPKVHGIITMPHKNDSIIGFLEKNARERNGRKQLQPGSQKGFSDLSKSLQEYPSLYRLGMNCAKPVPDKNFENNHCN